MNLLNIKICLNDNIYMMRIQQSGTPILLILSPKCKNDKMQKIGIVSFYHNKNVDQNES